MSTNENAPSVHDSVRAIAAELKLPFVLRANNTLVKYDIKSGERVTVLVEFLTTTETAREVRYTRRGKRLMSWEARYDYTDIPEGELTNWKYSEVVMWDDTFEPYVENKIGRIESPAEYAERRRWEGEQYRVGSPRSPMDSAHRVTLGHTPMADYWNK